LQIDQLWDIRMHEDVMTAADTPQFEAQRLGESAKIAKRDIGHIASREPLEELALIHDETVVTAWDGTVSRPGGQRMFGGLSFLINGYMSVSVSRSGGLLLRCDPTETETLLAQPHAAPFEMRGREMRGWLRVLPDGVRTKRQLERWVDRGVSYARSPPAKH
jgi:hypothetical protein